MKLRKFTIGFLILVLILCAVWLGMAVAKDGFHSKELPDRSNQKVVTDQRVFDYAGKLTEKQEKDLETLIKETEKETQCDIVLVIIDESLEAYTPAGSGSVPMDTPDDWMCAVADDFWDLGKFGWNASKNGDGVLLLNNWYRESYDGKRHTWISTSGRVVDELDSSDIDGMLEDVNGTITSDPYEGYKGFVEACGSSLKVKTDGAVSFGWQMVVIPVLTLLALWGVYLHYHRKLGTDTVTTRTYLDPGKDVQIQKKVDRFLHREEHRTKIEREDSHTSSSGSTHGGGGASF